MDNLTHTMAAILLSRAGLDRLAPRAVVTLALAANAPDLDVVAAAWGSLAYLRHHRGLSHAVVALPILAALVALVVRLLAGRKEFRWGRVYLLALAGAASHLMLDFSNLYGVRPWLPFSSSWYSWDIVFIADVWIWAALAAALALPALGRLVSGEIGGPPGTGRAAAVLGLLFLLAWWGVRDLLQRRAVAMLASHAYGERSAPQPPQRVAAFPDPASLFRWRGFVETAGFYQILPVDVRRPLDPLAGRVIYKPEPSAALEAARSTRTAAEFAAFARYGFAVVDPAADGHRVVFSDFRFSGERPNAFVCTIALDRQLRVVREDFSF